jgi:hypothetical protein
MSPNKRSRAVHTRKRGEKRTLRKSPGICLTCYDYVDYLYNKNGKSECYYCSRGIRKPQ